MNSYVADKGLKLLFLINGDFFTIDVIIIIIKHYIHNQMSI